MQKTLRTYFRPETRCSLKAQRAVASKFDGEVVDYTEAERRQGDGFPIRSKWITAARKGELLGVPFFHRLATSNEDLKSVRASIRERGAVIVEIATGRRSDCASALGDMIQEAQDFYARRGMTKAEARKLGKMGAAASPVTKARTDRLPNELAEEILNDHATYSTLKLALRAINAATNADGKEFKRRWTIAHVYQQVRKKRLNLKPRRPGPRVAR